MGLYAEALSTARRPGPDCKLRAAMVLHPEHADDIAKIVKDRAITAAGGARVFVAAGIDLTRHTIERHRNGDCSKCRDAGEVW